MARRPRAPFIAPACLPLALAGLAGCQVVPPVGSTTVAQVLSLPAQRDSLAGGHRDLHGAIRAGVTRAEVEAGRLVRGECVEPDAQSYGGRVSFTVTTVMPAGTAWPVPTLVEVVTPQGVTPDAVGARPQRQHGRYLGPLADAAGREPPRCRPEGSAPGVMRLNVSMRYSAWQHDFAAAEVARHAQFTDAEFDAREVVELGCRVEALGDADFMRVRWFARRPPGMPLATGDIVRLRAGASEDSKDVTPLAQILGAEPRVPVRGTATVTCR